MSVKAGSTFHVGGSEIIRKCSNLTNVILENITTNGRIVPLYRMIIWMASPTNLFTAQPSLLAF